MPELSNQREQETAAAPPSTLVIFGASGDLTRRLLMPALYNLADEGVLDQSFAVIGVDRVERSDEDFREYLTGAMKTLVAAGDGEFAATALDARAWDWVAERLGYITGDFDSPETYARVGERLSERAKVTGRSDAVFYLAVGPRFFGPIVEKLGAAGLLRESDNASRRVVIEKPFGTDLASAKALNARVLKVARERQLYRIDHFLGKETVQNVMSLRFANGIFEPIWNRDHIEHVQIMAAETVTVEQRGRFYDATGALRDMVPNHMFQLLAMIAMEAPNSFDADAVRTEKAKAIEAIRRLSPEAAVKNAVRGQYGAGNVRGNPVDRYVKARDVARDSRTETYVALKLLIDNWRWSGVPFFIRTGKAMGARCTSIAIQFKRAPGVLFRDTAVGALEPNVMVLRIQPNEGISLCFAAKIPGRAVQLSEVKMDFRYSDYFQSEPATGYETLIYDCLIGDPMLFQRADNIEAGWAAVQPLLDAWATGESELHLYEAGGSGPAGAEDLLARDGFRWIPLE